MTTAKDLLTLARGELGITEDPPNSNKVKYNTAYYGRAVSGASYPWCCAFIWWLFRQAKADALFYGGGKTASCTTLYNHYKARGQTVSVSHAQPGDLVFFRFNSGLKAGIMEHIGICESVSGGYITTIDGNTGTTNEANGGAVMRRKRAVKYVGGVARPKYEKEKDVLNMTEKELRNIVRDECTKMQNEINAKPVSDFAKKDWEALQATGVTDGTRPQAPLTREQYAFMEARKKAKGLV